MNGSSEAHRIQRFEQQQDCLSLDPDNVRLLYEAADRYLRAGTPHRARPIVERLVVLQPNDTCARYYLAVLLFQERRFGESLGLSQTILDEGEEHPAVRYQHARTLAQFERFDEARVVLAQLVEAGCDVDKLPHLFVRSPRCAAIHGETVEYVGGYVQRGRGDDFVVGMMGLLCLDDDRLVDATLIAERALSHAPNNLDALLTLGFAAMAFGDVDRAKEYFDCALMLNARNGRAHLGRALAAMSEGDLSFGRLALEESVRWMPRYLGARNGLAWVQILQGDFDSAHRTLACSLDRDCCLGETYGGLAVVSAWRGEWEESRCLVENAVRLDPEGFACRFAKSVLLACQSDHDRARILIRAMLKSMVAPGGCALDDLMRRFIASRKIRPVSYDRSCGRSPAKPVWPCMASPRVQTPPVAADRFRSLGAACALPDPPPTGPLQ